METNETELVQLIRQIKDYVILDKRDYEKLVQNSKSTERSESILDARDAQITLLEQQLARQEDWINYWKNKYKECLEELKKKTTSKIKWWRF
nr:hypothetical protein [Prevotella sp.]